VTSWASKVTLWVARQFDCTCAATTFLPTRRTDAGTVTFARLAFAFVVCGAFTA
jgi:hypothetical protein